MEGERVQGRISAGRITVHIHRTWHEAAHRARAVAAGDIEGLI